MCDAAGTRLLSVRQPEAGLGAPAAVSPVWQSPPTMLREDALDASYFLSRCTIFVL